MEFSRVQSGRNGEYKTLGCSGDLTGTPKKKRRKKASHNKNYVNQP
jgi:hypothetical protein